MFAPHEIKPVVRNSQGIFHTKLSEFELAWAGNAVALSLVAGPVSRFDHVERLRPDVQLAHVKQDKVKVFFLFGCHGFPFWFSINKDITIMMKTIYLVMVTPHNLFVSKKHLPHK